MAAAKNKKKKKKTILIEDIVVPEVGEETEVEEVEEEAAEAVIEEVEAAKDAGADADADADAVEAVEQPEDSKPKVLGKVRLRFGGALLFLAGFCYLAICLSTVFVALMPVIFGVVSFSEFSWASTPWLAYLPIFTLTILAFLSGVLSFIRAGKRTFSLKLIIFALLALALGLGIFVLLLLDLTVANMSLTDIITPLWSLILVLRVDFLVFAALNVAIVLSLILGSTLAISGNLAKRK